MGKRVVGPIEHLRGQALASTGVAGSLGPVEKPSALVVSGQDEITELVSWLDSRLSCRGDYL